MNELGYAMAQEAYQVLSRRSSHDLTFTLLDLEWTQLDDVVGSEYNQASGMFASWLPYAEAKRFLEMGCGHGVASVLAARHGCQVTALDINPAAVRNTELNAERHGVADRVHALESDLFSALRPDDKFDLIYWNSPFVEVPEDRAMDSIMAYHFFDPGYAMHRDFFHTAPAHLTESGRIFLGHSQAMGNLELLNDLGREVGLDCQIHRQEQFAVPPAELGSAPEIADYSNADGLVQIDFALLEFRQT